MLLKPRSNLLQRKILHILHENNCMGISHRYTGHPVGFPLYLYGLCDHLSLFIFSKHRDFTGLQDRFSHIDLHSRHPAILYMKIEILDPSRTDHTDLRLIRQSLIVYIFSHTSDPVSAHFCTGSVHIVHFHFKIRLIRRVDEDHAIPANTKMSVAQTSYELRLLLCRDPFPSTIDINIVISTAMHFRKFKHRETLLFLYCKFYYIPYPI